MPSTDTIATHHNCEVSGHLYAHHPQGFRCSVCGVVSQHADHSAAISPAAAPDGEGEPTDAKEIVRRLEDGICPLHGTADCDDGSDDNDCQRWSRLLASLTYDLDEARARITEGDAERESLREGWSRTNASSEATFQRAIAAESRLSTLEGENARLREENARLREGAGRAEA